MSEKNKALIQRWFEEVWNKGRAEAVDEMFAADGIAHGLSDDVENPLRGPTSFKKFHAKFREAFPDIMVTVEDMISEGDKVAARCLVHGRHMGDSLGIAATQAKVEFTGTAIVRVENGKIVEAWNNFRLHEDEPADWRDLIGTPSVCLPATFSLQEVLLGGH